VIKNYECLITKFDFVVLVVMVVTWWQVAMGSRQFIFWLRGLRKRGNLCHKCTNMSVQVKLSHDITSRYKKYCT